MEEIRQKTAEEIEADRLAEHPADFTAHTVRGQVPVCAKHARALQNVMRVLGTAVHFTASSDGEQCSNCRNEAGLAA